MSEILKDFVATEDGLGVYIPEIETLVYADLHLGIEHTLFNEGTYLPINQFQIMLNRIILMIEKFQPKILLINGDFKHEFSKATSQEWFELQELINLLKKKKIILEIVRGNHDNYLKTILNKFGMNLNDPFMQIGKYMFIHGHENIFDEFFESGNRIEWIILAHEHPAIILYDDINGKHKFKCYLLGSWNDYKVLVLPTMSPLASGTIINSVDTKFLSPILRNMDIQNFRPYVFDNGELLRFPKIKDVTNVEEHSE